MLKANPKLMYSGEMNLWVKSVKAVDPRTVVIELNNPNPRFFVDYFGVRIWETVLIRRSTSGRARTRTPSATSTSSAAYRSAPGHTSGALDRDGDGVDRLPKWWGPRPASRTCPSERVIWIAAPTEDCRGEGCQQRARRHVDHVAQHLRDRARAQSEHHRLDQGPALRLSRRVSARSALQQPSLRRSTTRSSATQSTTRSIGSS